jgi:ABC-type multidrug transport system ATPase subunit
MPIPLLITENVCKSFGRRQVLRGGTLRAHAGELVGIVGENGSGKSTLLKIIMRLLKPDSGAVQCTARIGYSPQEPVLYEHLTVAEHFRLFGAAYEMSAAATWARSTELMETFSFQGFLHHQVHQLSGGTRQKLNLSLALLHDPALLLLDEPYAGFDWETYQRFLDYTREATRQGKCLVMVSHLVYERERFHALYELTEGVIHG